MVPNLHKALVAFAAAATMAGGAFAADTPPSREARIPFTSSVRDFRADGQDAIYVQDVHRQWYRGTFFAPCHGLPFATTIGFSNRGMGGLDRWATIYARGSRCTLTSFVTSGGAPDERHARATSPSSGT